MSNKKMKSIGVATLKTLGAQYSSFVGILEQVTALHSEFESELSQALSLLHTRQKKHEDNKMSVESTTDSGDITLLTDPDEDEFTGSQKQLTDNVFEDEIDNLNVIPWLKKLFKKIAICCHPDKVLTSNAGVTEKHKRLSSYENARTALDENDQPMMISIGLLYDEIPDLGILESKKILTVGVTSLQSQLESRQKSVVWTWGMSEDNLQIKSKILVHAAMKLYNRSITESEALKVVKEYFEIRDIKNGRKVGSHPGTRLKNRRNKAL
jgi:hypothetical protein